MENYPGPCIFYPKLLFMETLNETFEERNSRFACLEHLRVLHRGQSNCRASQFPFILDFKILFLLLLKNNFL